MDDYEWALDRVTRMCASALVDAQIYRQKLLKGFGYPNEVFHSAQDYRALNIILSALQQAQAPQGHAELERIAELRDCTCLGTCKGKAGLAPGWRCALEASDVRALDAAVEKVFGSRPEPTLARRLGWMADAMVSAKVGPQARFFTRERVDEIVLLLREAERRILEGK